MSDWNNNPNAPKETAMGRFAPIQIATAPVPDPMQDVADLREKTLNHAAYVGKLQARIESLEAERDIWRGRAGKMLVIDNMPKNVTDPPGITRMVDWPDPTPSEIAARVAERRKEPSR